jgi:methionyl-tRNA formyltransferase
MRVVFAGTPEFAAVALRALLDADLTVVGVLTGPDRCAGRGLKPRLSPVKILAQEWGLTIFQPHSLKPCADTNALCSQVAALRPDVIVTAAYGLILPAGVLAIPRWGGVNIHASLLPRWRGAAPIQRALEAGDTHTGISIMQMDCGLDTGPILLKEAIPIAPEDTAGRLHDRLATRGAALIVQALRDPDSWSPQAQPEEGVSYAAKIGPADCAIHWQDTASRIERQIRALQPVPGAQTSWKGGMLKIIAAQCATHPAPQAQPGQIVGQDEQGVYIACGEGHLCITRVHKAGAKPMSVADFLRGSPLAIGECWGQPHPLS